MEITLLGTGTSQGVPVIACDCEVCKSDDFKDKRLRSSVLIRYNNLIYVIDTGTDFRLQMLKNDIKRLDGIFYTHEHADHTAGIDDIRPLYFARKSPIPIYAQERVINDLKKRFEYIFTDENRYPGAPRVNDFVPKPYRSYFIAGTEVTAFDILHGDLQIYGYKFGDFAYITDAKTVPEKTIRLLKGIKVLVINALHHKQHKMHLNLKESLKVIEQIKPEKAILTHISHHMGRHDKISKLLPDRVYLGYDGMKIEL